MKRIWSALVAATLCCHASAAPPVWADFVDMRFPGSLLGIKVGQWIGFGALLLAGVIAREVLVRLVSRALSLREKLAGVPTVPSSRRTVRRGAGLLAFVIPWYLFGDQLELSPLVATRVGLGVQAITIVAAVLLAYGVWDVVCDALSHRAGTIVNAERLLIPVTRKLVRVVILIAGALLALGVFGVNITGLLAGVGIGGLVVALAAKDSVENIFGSLTILFDMPFALGDWVKIDRVEGIVEEINLRSTKIRTFEDSLITLPNSNLIKAAVENFGARRFRRQRLHVRVNYLSQPHNVERFVALIKDHLTGQAGVVQEKTVVELNDLTEGSMGVLVQCFFDVSNFAEEAKMRGELLEAILRASRKAGVVMTGIPLAPEPSKQASEGEAAD